MPGRGTQAATERERPRRQLPLQTARPTVNGKYSEKNGPENCGTAGITD